MIKFRNLKADEIDVRVGQVKENGCSLLLYKDARCDMHILDECVGIENWQREHYECKGNLFCKVGILTEKGWVYKSDCGKESHAEKEKGESSDSFKRACVNWGIGRELYTSPFIWVTSDNVQIVKGKNGKATTYDKFYVEKIEIEDNAIKKISIVNRTLSTKNKKIVRAFVKAN